MRNNELEWVSVVSIRASPPPSARWNGWTALSFEMGMMRIMDSVALDVPAATDWRQNANRSIGR